MENALHMLNGLHRINDCKVLSPCVKTKANNKLKAVIKMEPKHNTVLTTTFKSFIQDTKSSISERFSS